MLHGLVLGGKLEPDAADDARADHFAFTVVRHEVAPFAERIWELRHRFSSDDAWYLALAEALAVPLYTCDAKLTSSGHAAEVRALPGTH